ARTAERSAPPNRRASDRRRGDTRDCGGDRWVRCPSFRLHDSIPYLHPLHDAPECFAGTSLAAWNESVMSSAAMAKGMPSGSGNGSPRPKDIFVISDLHLGDGGARDNFEAGGKTRALRSFLDHVGSEGGELFVLGDLLELWQMNLSVLFVKRRELF